MGLFKKSAEGGTLSVLRSPEEDYLIHKWRSSGQAGDTTRENTIRWGSSLRVRDGEVAVFVYSQNGQAQDFIEGPFDQILKTANLPMLASVVGLAYGGDSPFQAQVYFINRAGTQKLDFRLPWFEVAESQPNLGTFTVPCTVQGTVYFSIDDYKAFIKLNRLTDFDLHRMRDKVMPLLQGRIKGIVSNIGGRLNIPLVQLERAIDTVREEATQKLAELFERDIGLRVKSVEIASIELQKTSDGYQQLKSITTDQVAATQAVMGDVQRQNFLDMQSINAEHTSETMRLQREQMAFSQSLQTKQHFLGAFALEKQAEVLKAGAESLGVAGQVGGGAGGFNPAGIMMGVGLGGVLTGQMTGMLAGLGSPGMPMAGGPAGGPPPPPPAPPMPPSAPTTAGPTPPMPGPPPPKFFLAVSGAQYGPYDMEQLRAFATTGQFLASQSVWREGMPSWLAASNVPELVPLFVAPPTTPVPPPIPSPS